MAGLQDPVVLFPRYTSFIGGMTYTTAPIPCQDYSAINISFWHGTVVGTFSFVVLFNESSDGENWTQCGGGPWAFPFAPSEASLSAVLTKSWLQFVIILGGGGGSGVTLWAEGFLERRER
jgi:hypothetical protein